MAKYITSVFNAAILSSLSSLFQALLLEILELNLHFLFICLFFSCHILALMLRSPALGPRLELLAVWIIKMLEMCDVTVWPRSLRVSKHYLFSKFKSNSSHCTLLLPVKIWKRITDDRNTVLETMWLIYSAFHRLGSSTSWHFMEWLKHHRSPLPKLFSSLLLGNKDRTIQSSFQSKANN